MTGLHPAAQEVIRTLKRSGAKAYAVGGCVRDLLLGRAPGDWDVATSARPETVSALFPRTFATGLRHGTVTVVIDDIPVEVTTFRTEGTYADRRHPDAVLFTDDPSADAVRRDFTVNALYWDGEGEILDFFGGREDLERKRLRTVGDGRRRFSEDALRILRAARFAAQLGFSADPQVRDAMYDCRDLLGEISRERIGEELERLLLADPCIGGGLLSETDCFSRLDPQLSVGEEDLRRCARTAAEPLLRWTALLWNCDRPGDRLRGFRRDHKTVARAQWLIAHKTCAVETEEQLRRLAAEGGKEAVRQLLSLRGIPTDAFDRLCRNGGTVDLSTLAIRGRDLLDRGIAPGEAIGAIRRRLLEEVLSGRLPNEKESLLEWMNHENIFTGER